MTLEVAAKVEALIAPIVSEEGCELVAVELTNDIGQRVLRVYIDRPGGVSLKECEAVSHAIEDVIEVEGVVPGRYFLEVSSPGLNRPLKTLQHFEAVKGKIVNILTIDKLEGRRRFKGVLMDVIGSDKEGVLTVHIDNENFQVPLAAVQKANLVFEME